MRTKSLIFIDTNVCIHRTIANIQKPEIYSKELSELKRKINDLTNNNSKCKLIISDIVYSELKNEKVLTNGVIRFCRDILKHPKNSHRTFAILNAAKKSIDKFCNKYYIDEKISEIIKNSQNNLGNVDKFYLQFPDRLREITRRKIRYLNGWKKKVKIKQRQNNMPERADRMLLCQAIELEKNSMRLVGILSNDSDFTKFIDEIFGKFNIEIEDSFRELN